MSVIAIDIALDVAWDWFQRKAPDVIKKIVDEVLVHIYRIVSKVDEALEILWRDFAKPVLQTIFPILGRILSFPGDVLEFIFGKVFDLFKFLFGVVSVPVHEIELKIYEVVVDAVSMVYRAVASMFVNVYNAVRSVYVGLRDVTAGFILSTVRRIRERLHTIITVDLWILGCWRAFQGSLESFSFGDFLKSAVLCLMAPVASGYIAGIITSLTPTPGTEFPGFVPGLEFPELRVEDMPRFAVVTPPPVMFPTVGVSTLPFAPVMDLSVRYEVLGFYVLSDSVSIVLSDIWVVPVGFVLSDSVGVGLSDVWSYGVGRVFGFNDSVGLGLIDGWSYGLAGVLGLSDSSGLSLTDGWSYVVRYDLGLSDGAGLGLFDAWSVSLDEVSLVRSVDLDLRYPAVVDVVDLVGSAGLLGMYGVSDSVSLRLLDRMGLLVDEVSLGEFVGLGVGYTAVITVDGVVITEISTRVGYPAVVDAVDIVVSAGLVGFYGLSDSASLRLFDGWRALLDEVMLVKIAGFSFGYPAVVDVVDLVSGAGLFGFFSLSDGVGLRLSDSWSALLDEVMLVKVVDFGVGYPAVVDVIDLVKGVDLGWGIIFNYGLGDSVG